MRGFKIYVRGVRTRRPENSLDNVFFSFIFCPQFILQFTEGVQWFYYRENYTFPRIKTGLKHFPGASNFFQVGGNAYFYRNPYNS